MNKTMSYTFLQNYWWFLIALLGGLLVFLMFVQGANLHLGNRTLSTLQKRMILNSTGRKWELTFTTLVTFGGAFFASFPLFYSTSFGGAYWVWVLILITFVFQAVSYEFQNKQENLIGSQAFRVFLMINALLDPPSLADARRPAYGQVSEHAPELVESGIIRPGGIARKFPLFRRRGLRFPVALHQARVFFFIGHLPNGFSRFL